MDMIGIIKRVIKNNSTSIFSNYSILNNILYDYAKSDYTNQRLVELFLQLIKNDKNCILSGLVGDGSYNTLESKSWFVNNEPSGDTEIVLPDNVG